MIIQYLREQLEATPWKSDATIDGHLAEAINALAIIKPEVAKTLLAIYDQKGCDHMDCGPRPEHAGRLTQAISVIIFG